VTLSLNSGANNLSSGSYANTLVFENTTSGTGTITRKVNLTANEPGILEVIPVGDYSSSGTVGGPFNPTSFVYTVTNSGQSSLTWSINQSQSWATLSSTDGTLAAGSSTNIILTLTAAAANLAEGSYSNFLTFVNSSTGRGNTQRALTLQNAPLAVSISLAERGTDYFRIGFQGYPNRSYTILVSSDLAAWATAGTVTTGSDGKVIYDAPASSSTTNVFYRVKLVE
jgi:hypothetical protein